MASLDEMPDERLIAYRAALGSGKNLQVDKVPDGS
jgi:hypothetical protein